MRLIYKNNEYYIFKDCYYSTPNYYLSARSRSLADKHLSSFYRPLASKHTQKLLDTLIKSPIAPELNEPPKALAISSEDQVADFINYLKKDFDIHMDDRARFYTKMTPVKRPFIEKTSIVYFSFSELVLLYNSPHNFIVSYFEANSEYILKRYNMLNELSKTYSCLDLKRLKGGKIISDSKEVVTLPTEKAIGAGGRNG